MRVVESRINTTKGRIDVNNLIDKIRVDEKRKKRKIKIISASIVLVVTITGIVSSL